jgi:hypothetical protein
MKMWCFLLVLFICAENGHAIVLDRNQFTAWYPDYLTDTEFNLNYRQITSISSGTFTGLSQLKRLDLNENQLKS